MLRTSSHIASYLFLPLFMPLFALFLVIRFDPYMAFFLPPVKAKLTLIVVALSTVLFPLINLFLLRKAGIISSYGLEVRRERLAPAVSTMIYFALGYFLIRKGELPPVLYSLYLGALGSVIAASLITLKWKISMHAIGIGGVLGGLYGVFQMHEFFHLPLFLIVLVACGWVMTARLALGVHTPAQVYAGFLLGFSMTWFSVIAGVYV